MAKTVTVALTALAQNQGQGTGPQGLVTAVHP